MVAWEADGIKEDCVHEWFHLDSLESREPGARIECRWLMRELGLGSRTMGVKRDGEEGKTSIRAPSQSCSLLDPSKKYTEFLLELSS